MTDKQIIIDENICDYYSDIKEDEEGANPIVGWCHDNYCKCEDIPIDECIVKAIQYCKLKDKQLKRKEQECEALKAELEQETALKETYLACYKTKHEDIKGIFFKYKQTLTEIKEIASKFDYWNNNLSQASEILHKIIEKINEVLDE